MTSPQNAQSAALEALIDAHAVELKLPTLRHQFRSLAEQATSRTTSTSDRVVLNQAITLVLSEAINPRVLTRVPPTAICELGWRGPESSD